MKILLANNHLFQLGGSETFTYTLAKEFERRGHDVDVFAIEKGGLFTLRLNIVDEPADSYDLILVSHRSCLPRVSRTKGPKIFTSHGVFPELEQPCLGADHYVAISDEVARHLRSKGFDPTVIHNGVDCERFSPRQPLRSNLGRVLCLSQSDQAKSMVKTACAALGIEFFSARGVWEIENLMNDADLVVTLGRGAYEAMACGREVIVFDYRWYIGAPFGDGIVTIEKYSKMLECNFSGRSYKQEFTVEDLANEFTKYNPMMGEFNRSTALKCFDVRHQADSYLKLAGLL